VRLQQRVVVPLRERPWDLVIVAFFLVNLCFVTYFVDIEQLTIANPAHFRFPLWPPRPIVEMVHAYGRRYDPLLMARPPFWKMLIWMDVLGFGPFYAVAVYAFVRGREWIRTPAIFWSGLMVTDVLVILSQEHSGQWATPHFGIVLALNLPWLALPVAVLVRLAVAPHPFTRPAAVASRPSASVRA